MLLDLAWVVAAGLAARTLLPGRKPNLLWASVCAAGGWALCFLAARALLSNDETALFAPECLLPAVLVAISLLAVTRRVRSRNRRTVFY